jgi:hypothetical protein
MFHTQDKEEQNERKNAETQKPIQKTPTTNTITKRTAETLHVPEASIEIGRLRARALNNSKEDNNNGAY